MFKKVNLEQFAKLDKFDSKIFPDGFANSLASVPNRFALWLQNELQTRYGLVTEVNSKGTGLISKSVQSASNEVNFEEKDVTSTFSLGSASESTENADEGIGNSASEKLEEFYNSLSLPQKLSLISYKITNGFYNVDEDGNDRTKELLEDGSQGRRKQYIISALITAMTDNAKERLAKKLGLSRNALAIATTMTAMGVPIETSILMMKNPTISLAYKLESRAPEFTFGLCLSSS